MSDRRLDPPEGWMWPHPYLDPYGFKREHMEQRGIRGRPQVAWNDHDCPYDPNNYYGVPNGIDHCPPRTTPPVQPDVLLEESITAWKENHSLLNPVNFLYYQKLQRWLEESRAEVARNREDYLAQQGEKT